MTEEQLATQIMSAAFQDELEKIALSPGTISRAISKRSAKVRSMTHGVEKTKEVARTKKQLANVSRGAKRNIWNVEQPPSSWENTPAAGRVRADKAKAYESKTQGYRNASDQALREAKNLDW